MAAQLLNSNTIPVEHGIRQACRHLENLISNDTFLPSYLVTWIGECLEKCRDIGTGHGVTQEQLSATVGDVLEEVRRVLTESAARPD